jgi:hypothetical protein
MSGLAIAGLAVGVGEFTIGEINKSKAKKKAAQLAANRPKLTNSPYTQEQYSLAESELGNGGLGAAASRALDQENEGSQTNVLSAIMQGGGDSNSVSKIFSDSEAGNQRLALMKENLRLQKIQSFVQASQNKDAERQQQFQYNVDAPFKDAAQATAQARQEAEAQINSGINTGVSSLLQGIGKFTAPTTKTSGGLASNYSSPNDLSVEQAIPTNAQQSVASQPQYNTLSNQSPQLNYNFNISI